jgi:hypothetical protein
VSRGVPPWLVPFIVMACAALIFLGVSLIVSELITPSARQIRRVCVAHDGVASLALPAITANPLLVVCRDGYAGYAE